MYSDASAGLVLFPQAVGFLLFAREDAVTAKSNTLKRPNLLLRRRCLFWGAHRVRMVGMWMQG